MNCCYPSLCTNVFFFLRRSAEHRLVFAVIQSPWVLFSFKRLRKYVPIVWSKPLTPTTTTTTDGPKIVFFISIVWSTLASVAPPHKKFWLLACFAAAENNKAFAPPSNPTQHSGHTWCKLRTPSIQLNKMAWFTGFIRLARTQTSAISEHAKEAKIRIGMRYSLLIEIKEAIHIRLHPNNINRDNGIEIPEAWMPMVKKHSRRMVQQQMPEGETSCQNIAVQNALITADQS